MPETASSPTTKDHRLTCTALFPPALKHEAVLSLMRALSGPLAPRRLRRATTVVFELYATDRGVTFLVTPPRGAEMIFQQLLSTHLPGVILTPVDEAADPIRFTAWDRVVEIGTSRAHQPLRIDQPDAVVASLLSGFTGLAAGEVLAQQSVITGGPTRAKASGRDGPKPLFGRLLDPAEVNKKYAEPVFLAVGRLAAKGPRPDQLIGRTMAQLGSLRTHSVRFERQRTNHDRALERLRQRATVLAFPAQLNAAEVAVVAAIPTGAPNISGLPIANTRRLPAHDAIPRDELVIATSNFPGAQDRPMGLRAYDLVKHTHILGRNGVGKSTLMVNLAVRQMAAGYGVGLIDPTGDTAADVLERIPPERARDVIMFEPTGPDHFVGFNIFDGTGNPEVLADQLMAIFHGIYQDSGIYTSNYLRAAIQTLASVPGQTLVEVVPFLTDPQYRGRIVRQVSDPILTDLWQRFDLESHSTQMRMVQPAIHRVQPLLLRQSVRRTLGQADNQLDMRRVLRERKILIVSIPKGHLGEETSALFGSLVFARMWQAAMALQRHERHPYFLHIDEAQNFLHMPLNIGDVLAEARKYQLGLTLVHQHTGQLPPHLRSAIQTNSRTKIAFAVSAEDSHAVARELGPPVEPGDALALGKFEILLQATIDEQTTPPATARTLPLLPVTSSPAAVRAASQATWATHRDAIDAAILARQQPAEEPSTRSARGWEAV